MPFAPSWNQLVSEGCRCSLPEISIETEKSCRLIVEIDFNWRSVSGACSSMAGGGKGTFGQYLPPFVTLVVCPVAFMQVLVALCPHISFVCEVHTYYLSIWHLLDCVLDLAYSRLHSMHL